MWWVPLSDPPPSLGVCIERQLPRDFAYGADQDRTILNETVWVVLDNYRWIVTTAWWRVVEDDEGKPVAKQLIGVLASEPPGFGWWMPSLKEPW